MACEYVDGEVVEVTLVSGPRPVGKIIKAADPAIELPLYELLGK
ncbi:MAG TPA: hypothetical protein VMQ86_16265 [Bryobacteraceae bacterium]|jgi:hypothetical protein|nr:hypothetical protein [Bryobacteraceae bacterium]